MFDVFTEEIEVLIKDGIASLYWFKKDLKKAWLRSGVTDGTWESIAAGSGKFGDEKTKREMMDDLYDNLRGLPYNRRLEISRNFVRLLVEQRDFTRQDDRHKIETAERAALKLREIISQQQKESDYREQIRLKTRRSSEENYHALLGSLRERFVAMKELDGQRRGYELEKLICELYRISNVPVEEPFKIIGEQIDGAIKYDGHFYLMEIRWREEKAAQSDIASLMIKVEGKLEARGLFLSMNGYTAEVLKSLPTGKSLRILLFDGIHLANVIYGMYTLGELLEHAISQASTRGNIYCSRDLSV